MRKAPLLLSRLTAAVLLALAPACGSGDGNPPPNTPPVTPPPATPPPANPPDPGPTTVDLTQFARNLVQQDTNDTGKPRELGGISFTDSEDPNAFGDDFFPPQ